MREFTVEVGDNYFSSAAPLYTSCRFNDVLGMADQLIIHALTMSVAGTGPTLTCDVQHSANGLDWVTVATPPINAQTMVSNTVLQGVLPFFNPPLLTYVRLKFTAGGTSPSCRLRVTVTGRVSASAPAADGGMVLQT